MPLEGPIPDEIKTIVDKTASFVARLGPEFEKRIIENERNNPKFSFLIPTDPLHGFYLARIQQFKAEAGASGAMIATSYAATSYSAPEELPPPPPPSFDIQEPSYSMPAKHGPVSLSHKILAATRKLRESGQEPAPIPSQYVFDLPEDISSLDLDIIKLTAQFVARNGHQFQVGLLNREFRNQQFDFLKTNHAMNPYFLALVESYTRCILPPKGISEKLRTEYANKQELLEKIIMRYEWDKEQEEKRRREEEKNKEDQIASLIEWHDFVIVETINFADEEAPPISMEQERTAVVEMETEDMEMEVDEKPKPPSEMRIRKDYVKPSARPEPVKVQRCPKCGQDIPVDQIDAHMKLELLDPNARVQRQLASDRSKGVSLASDDEIARNLGSFARRRTDIFGSEEVEIGRSVTGEEENPDADKLIWDGHTASIPAVSGSTGGRSLDDQIAAIHASKGVVPPPSEPIQRHPMPPAYPPVPMAMPMPPPPNHMMPRPPMPSPMVPPPAMPFRPPPPMMHPPPLPMEDEPSAKKQKVEEGNVQLIPEAEFLARHPGPITVKVQCPLDNEKPEFKGQVLSIQVNMTDTVAVLKDKIKEQIGLAPNKQKLKGNNIHLKDQPSMAYYNFTSDSVITLSTRERGGKRGKKQ